MSPGKPVRIQSPLRVNIGRADVPRYISTLDGWRALAILLVIIHHAGTVWFDSPQRYWSSSITRHGVLGVPIFFGLSGFLITALLLAEFRKRGRISLRGFYLRRSFRIVPPLLVYIATIAAVGLIATRMELLSSVFFFRNYLQERAGTLYTAHLWSLSIEEHFYLLWPLTLCFLLRGRHLLAKTIVIAASFGVWASVDFHFHFLHRLAPILDTPMRTDLRFGSLMWGSCAGIAFQSLTLCAWVARLFTAPVFAVSLGALICCETWPVPLATIWEPALIAALILGTATHPRWRLSRALEWPIIRWIGRISYSLYLWQQLFLIPGWEPHPLPLLQSFPVSLMLPFICATTSYFWIEKPAIRIGRKLAAGKLAGVIGPLGEVASSPERA